MRMAAPSVLPTATSGSRPGAQMSVHIRCSWDCSLRSSSLVLVLCSRIRGKCRFRCRSDCTRTFHNAQVRCGGDHAKTQTTSSRWLSRTVGPTALQHDLQTPQAGGTKEAASLYYYCVTSWRRIDGNLGRDRRSRETTDSRRWPHPRTREHRRKAGRSRCH